MKNDNSILLSEASIATSKEVRQGTLLVEDGKIAGIWYRNDDGTVNYDGDDIDYSSLAEKILGTRSPQAKLIKLPGKVIMAGAIDAHVHFREPGMTHKADMASESKAALLGGVTSFIDMPNNNPPATSLERLREKAALAEGRCFANWGFHIGADNSNPETLEKCLAEGQANAFAGIKVFMGSSTGNMLVDKGNALEDLFSITGSRILIHSEDEAIIKANLEKAKEKFGENIPMREHENIRSRTACIKSTIKALEMAMKHGTKLHVCHVTTAEEVEMIRTAKQYNPEITAETSANYLWFCNEDYDRLGSHVKCNPAIKTAADRAALRQAVKDGVIDTIVSDHATHLMEEKQHPYLSCPSGMPSIQQEISVLLTVASQEDIPLSRVASLISEKTAELFGIEDRGVIKTGMAADLIIIDPNKKFIVGESDEGAAGAAYKCGWTPYKGAELTGMVEEVFLAGRHVVAGGRLIDGTPHGTALKFTKF